MYKQSQGVSLIELMMVLTVLAILVAVGYPRYLGQMTESRRSDGQKILLEIMNQQQTFYSNNSSYTLDLIGDLSLIDAGGGAVASDKSFYLVSAAVCGVAISITDCVLLTAMPQGGQVSDGNLTYNSRNVKTPASHW